MLRAVRGPKEFYFSSEWWFFVRYFYIAVSPR